ncbi:hypothetical protein LguiB_027753 [Lonicera macranthoides]
MPGKRGRKKRSTYAIPSPSPKGGRKGNEDYISIDIEDANHKLATSIEKSIQGLPPILSECCIYRVPPKLRSLHEKAYTPQVVSIGPFHHGKKEFERMEEQKLRYLHAFLNRANLTLEDCIIEMKKWERKACNYYAEKIDLSDGKFLKMILIDCCFIIEAMLASLSVGGGRLIPYLPEEIFLFQTDLILLENQIPFFVLDGLFQLAFPSEQEEMIFLKVSIDYFSNFMLIKDDDKLFNKVKLYLKTTGFEVKHFIDLLRICFLPTNLRARPLPDKVKLITIRNAFDLQEAGMNLKGGSGNTLLDIIYTKGVLEIPRLIVEESSEIVLTNIVVLENCLYMHDNYIRDYVFFMHMLMDTPKDAELLIQNEIIENWLGDSKAIVTLFNKVGYEVLIDDSSYYFFDISEKINAYHSVTRHTWKATFKRDYCSTPMRIASTTTAVLLVVLTLMQTITSFIQVL